MVLILVFNRFFAGKDSPVRKTIVLFVCLLCSGCAVPKQFVISAYSPQFGQIRVAVQSENESAAR